MNKILSSFIQETGLKHDALTNTVFGYYGGYHVCLIPANNNSGSFSVILSVSRGGVAPATTDFQPLAKGCKEIQGSSVQQHRVTVTTKANAWSYKKSLANAKKALEETVSYLRYNGFTDCCQHCGQNTPTDTYLLNGTYMHLCPECFQTMNIYAAGQQYQEAQKTENIVGGIVGAFLGSLLGVLVMVLLDQLGYVAAISGIVMAICTLKGYELLGGKLSTVGTVISVIIMLIMVYMGNWITWAIAMYSELGDYYNMTFFDCFKALHEFIEFFGGEIQSSYTSSLVMQYVFVALGAVPTIITSGKNRKIKKTVHQLGGSTGI